MKVSDFSGVMDVDIATRMVERDEDIFILQPGRRYWLYGHYKKTNRIFLDFPGLELAFDQPVPKNDDLRQMIVRSLAIGGWLKDKKEGVKPAEDLKSYVGKDKRKRLGRYVGAIKRLHWEMKIGTIIVVPGPNYYDDVLIGEIVGESEMFENKDTYDGYSVAARRVKWLRSKPRSAFSEKVRERFGTPNPIMQLDRSLRTEILRAGYDQYAFDGEFTARLNTSKDDFSSLDDYNIQTFVNYVAGVVLAMDDGRTTEISFDEALKYLKGHPDSAPELKLNINSKGFQRLLDNTVMPQVIAALLSVALATSSASAATTPKVNISNSVGNPNDKCTVMVSQKVEGALKLMRLEDWKRVCDAATDAHDATGLSTTMRTKMSKKKGS